MANTNTAYNFDLFTEKPQVQKEPELNLVKTGGKRAIQEKIFVVKLVATVFAMLAVIAVTINSRIELMEISDQVAQMEKEYNTLSDENGRLNAQLESETSLRNVEEQARALGMAKIEEDQIDYVSLEKEDEIIVAKEKEGLLSKLILSFNGFMEYLTN